MLMKIVYHHTDGVSISKQGQGFLTLKGYFVF